MSDKIEGMQLIYTTSATAPALFVSVHDGGTWIKFPTTMEELLLPDGWCLTMNPTLNDTIEAWVAPLRPFP